MKEIFHKTINNPLISGTVVIFVGTLIANIFNFLFNLFMSRSLSLSDYGELASLVSVILLFALAADSFMPTVVHFAASYFAKNEIDRVRGLFWKATGVSFLIGGIILFFFVIFNPVINQFLKISNTGIFFLVGITVLLGFITTVNRALLQARLYFKYISLVIFLSSLVKLLIGVSLVLLGFGVGGAVWAFVLSFLLPYILMFFPLRFIFTKGKAYSSISFGKLFRYGGPATIALISLTLFITMDIILVKHFFSPEEAGMYAGLSLIGRVIFFFSAPIGTVMFPLIVQKHTRNEKYNHIFQLSIALVLFSSLALTAFYFLFPEFMIKLFLKKEYLSIAPLLGLFGIFMTIYTTLLIVTNFFLSTKRTEVFIPAMIGAIADFLLLFFFHDSFIEVILISITTASLLLFFLLLYYWKLYGNYSKK